MRRPLSCSFAPIALGAALAALLPLAACAQHIRTVAVIDSVAGTVDLEVAPGEGGAAVARSPTAPRSRADSIAWRRTRAAADRDPGFRVIVSLEERRLRVLDGGVTLLDAPAGVGSFDRLEYAGRVWTFDTPRGRRRVLSKDADPVWVPPDWHYAEVARDHGFRLEWLSADRPVRLRDGGRLEVRKGRVGVVRRGQPFAVLPVEEEIVFDSTLFIPPEGSLNRRIAGELGAFRLDLGDGYLLHGTPHDSSIGEAVTHGCVRLGDEHIAWLYENVPLGTPVYIY